MAEEDEESSEERTEENVEPSEEMSALNKELIELLKKYPMMSVLALIENDNSNERLLLGNICPVCGLYELFLLVKGANLQHVADTHKCADGVH